MPIRNWFVLALVMASACLTLYFALLGIAMLVLIQPWLAPGDPPVFDTLLQLGLVPVAGAAIAWAATAWMWRGDKSPVFRTARASFVLSAALVVIGGLGVAERHGPRWSALRSAIRRHASEIDAAVGDRARVLSREEFDALRQRLLPKPEQVWLAGVGYVQLRMAHGAYPYVGVDFGKGNHVEFDPATMFSLYSD